MSIFGNVIMASAFMFIGPLPSIEMAPTWTSITFSTGFEAFGTGVIMVSTFGRVQQAAIRKGFTKDIETYLMISGIANCSSEALSAERDHYITLRYLFCSRSNERCRRE